MPFSIELLNDKPFVKLQVNKNVITVYFYGASEKTVELRLAQWGKVDSLFLELMPEWNADWFRGSDAPHIKRNHTNGAEADLDHFHLEFTSEVTPKLLANYLKGFAKSSDFIGFKFFEAGEVDSIISTFTAYYRQYKGSLVETLFNEETKLTPDEEKMYERELQQHKKNPRVLNMLSFFAALDAAEASSSTASPSREGSCSIL